MDYHLKGCMEARFWTITLSEGNVATRFHDKLLLSISSPICFQWRNDALHSQGSWTQIRVLERARVVTKVLLSSPGYCLPLKKYIYLIKFFGKVTVFPNSTNYSLWTHLQSWQNPTGGHMIINMTDEPNAEQEILLHSFVRRWRTRSCVYRRSILRINSEEHIRRGWHGS